LKVRARKPHSNEDAVARIELLSPDAHRDVRIRTRLAAIRQDARHFSPVVVSEFAKLSAHYPIVFAKSAESGAFFAGAVLGIEAGRALLPRAADGWAPYLPLDMRRGPFFTSGDSLAIDLDHPRIDASDGELLFDGESEPTPYLRSIQAIITQLARGLEETERFIGSLLALKLVEPVDVSLRFDDGTARRLDGLYTVSLDRLEALADADALALFRSGHLRLIHIMAASLEQLPVLAQLHNSRLSQAI
jgi:hypothetical protein